MGMPGIGTGPRGDRSHELSRHHPFDLLVLRGKTVAASCEWDQAASGHLFGLPHGFGRRDEHLGPIFYTDQRLRWRACSPSSL